MAKLIDIIGKGLSSEPESEIKTAIDELEKLLAQ